MNVVTWPPIDVLSEIKNVTPQYMRPNNVPIAVALPDMLSKRECEEIRVECEKFPTHKTRGCNATTREIGHIPILETVKYVVEKINYAYFGYALDETPVSWMQTYGYGDNYQRHMDGSPGQMRKLTAVVMLSDPKDYEGGDLDLEYHPSIWVAPKSQGTIIVFSPWILHKVHEVKGGLRQTINMGFWGPNFR